MWKILKFLISANFFYEKPNLIRFWKPLELFLNKLPKKCKYANPNIYCDIYLFRKKQLFIYFSKDRPSKLKCAKIFLDNLHVYLRKTENVQFSIRGGVHQIKHPEETINKNKMNIIRLTKWANLELQNKISHLTYYS